MAAEDFRTGEDVFNAVMKTGRQSQSLTDQYATDVKMAIMQEYKSLLAHDQWYWAKAPAPGVLTTVARDQVSVSSIAGQTVTVGLALTPSRVGRKFYLNANQAFYRIAGHTAGASTFDLDAPYVETQTAGPATIYQDEYALASDVVIPWTPMRIRGQWERDLEKLGEQEFRARYGGNSSTAISIPEVFTVLRNDLAGSPVIQVAPWTTDRINVEYDYVAMPETLTFDGAVATDTPIIPEFYRWVLYQRALSQLFASKDDTLSERAWKRAELGIAEMQEKYMGLSCEPRFFSRSRHSLGVG